MQTTILENRYQKVKRLQAQALRDRQPHKWIQAEFILNNIQNRMHANTDYRKNFLSSLKVS